MPGDNSILTFFKGGKNTETVEKNYTAEDLQKADDEYVAAANELNAIDPGDDAQEEALMKVSQRYHEASKNYKKIHHALHPEMYTGENKNATFLPSVELNPGASLFAAGAALADSEGDKPLK